MAQAKPLRNDRLCCLVALLGIYATLVCFAGAVSAQSSLDACEGTSVTVTVFRGYASGLLIQETVSASPTAAQVPCGQGTAQVDLSPGSALESTLASLCSGEAEDVDFAPLPMTWDETIEHSLAPVGCTEGAVANLCVHCFIHGKATTDPPISGEFAVMAVVSEEFDDADTGAGFGFGLSGAYRLTERTALGAEMTYIANDGDTLDIATTNLDLFGRYYFAPGRDGADWFLRGGAGWSSISVESRFDFDIEIGDLLLEQSFDIGGFDDSFTVHAGVGVDIPRGRSLILRPEVIGRYYEQLEEVQLAVSLSLAFR